jgi:hypothetical protein
VELQDEQGEPIFQPALLAHGARDALRGVAKSISARVSIATRKAAEDAFRLLDGDIERSVEIEMEYGADMTSMGPESSDECTKYCAVTPLKCFAFSLCLSNDIE